MRLSADIKWATYSSTTKMRKHLSDYVCGKKSNLKRIFKGSNIPPSDQVEVSVKCGKVAERSSFVFLRGSRNQSQIIGSCSTNHLVDLIDDFDFLKEQMNQSNLTFTLGDPKIVIENNKAIEKANRRIFQVKSVLADFFGLIGFISGAAAYLLYGEFNQVTLLLFMLGLIFWMGSVVIGCWDQPKYVLIEKE